MADLQFKRFATTAAFNAEVNKAALSAGDVVYDAEAKINYIITGSSGGKNTVEPYYGKNAIVGTSVNGGTLTLTYADGTTEDRVIKPTYTLDEIADGTNRKLLNKWANLNTSTTASYNSAPEFGSVKIGNGTASATATSYCVQQYDATNKCLKFVFVWA